MPPRRRKFRRPPEPKRRKTEHTNGEREDYKEIVKGNTLLEKYYQGLGIVPPEEWEQFLGAMRRDLPATFRITGTRSAAETVLSLLEHKYFPEFATIEIEGEKVPTPRPLPWYPYRLAWNVSLSRMVIRHSPAVSRFHSFLVKENQQGNICRQEAVSMIPPLLLDVRSHHKVLDMCAAPGSKTAQLIEQLHADDCPIPAGIVVANDADNKRCYMLVHQAKRLNSPCLMVTNHDAASFPTMYLCDESGKRQSLLYDRILCDVPCSGDGTLRKNPIIWKDWTPSLAPSLHKLQLRILNRGLELLAPGGRLVYSTCSLNPVEDEAVVGAALQLSKGTVELVDCQNELVELKRMSGLSSWKVMTKTGEWLATPADIPKHMLSTLTSNMFAPDLSTLEQLHLERCMRVLPHHQDTGGFFIAVLCKKDWLPWQNKQRRMHDKATSFEAPCGHKGLGGKESVSREEGGEEEGGEDRIDGDGRVVVEEGFGSEEDVGVKEGRENVKEDMDISVGQESKGTLAAENKRLCDDKLEVKVIDNGDVEEPCRRPTLDFGKCGYQRRKMYKEDPFVFEKKEGTLWQPVKNYYGLPDSFPAEQLLTRTLAERKKNVYLASTLAKELTVNNEQSVRVISIGVKVLARCENLKTACGFRLCQEGIQTMAPFITQHHVQISLEDVTCLLTEPNPLTCSLSVNLQATLGSMEQGPVLFRYIPQSVVCQQADKQGPIVSCPIYLSGWVAAKSVRLLVGREDHFHYLAMLGYEPPDNQSLETVTSGNKHSEDLDEEKDEKDIDKCDTVLDKNDECPCDFLEGNEGIPSNVHHDQESICKDEIGADAHH